MRMHSPSIETGSCSSTGCGRSAFRSAQVGLVARHAVPAATTNNSVESK
jgi:hypothetical protein